MHGWQRHTVYYSKCHHIGAIRSFSVSFNEDVCKTSRFCSRKGEKAENTLSLFSNAPMCQTSSKTQTDTRTDVRNRIWCIFALKCDIWWHYFNDFFPDNWPNFVYLFDSGFLHFCEASAPRSPIGWTPLTESGWSDKGTNRRVSLSICVLDGVWHCIKTWRTSPCNRTEIASAENEREKVQREKSVEQMWKQRRRTHTHREIHSTFTARNWQ